MLSRTDCAHIHKPNCVFYTEGRYCPENCEGFESIGNIIKEVLTENESEIVEPILEEPNIKRRLRK